MKIAIEGCAHGDLEKIYDAITFLEERDNFKVDLLLCCGDFQATRNVHDLNTMAVPPKYRDMCTFYKYYSGEKVAPVLTIFIGGNHEASNHLQELPYGGWVAPNIFYLGLAGVVKVNGVRIAGLSGIYKPMDYSIGRYERPPYTEQMKRSIYHIRNQEVFRLKQLKQPIDIFMTHDWPRGVHKFGNVSTILKFKAHLKEDMETNKLGSQPAEELLYLLKPKYWFSAHLHCKFAAIVPHNGENGQKATKFLALDKCLPYRKFLQIMDIESEEGNGVRLEYDVEWLTVLHFTNHLTSNKRDTNILPNKDFAQDNKRWDFTPTDIEMDFVRAKMSNDFTIPENFVQTAPAYVPGQSPGYPTSPSPNPQTQSLCQKLGIRDMFEEVLGLEPLSIEALNRRSSESPATPNFNSFVESDLGNGSSSSDELGDHQTPTRSSSSWDSDTCSPMRSSLALPPPKNSETAEETSPSKRSLSPPLPQPTNTDVTSPEIKHASFVIDTTPAVTPTTHKKFKRRNMDIYKSNDDES